MLLLLLLALSHLYPYHPPPPSFTPLPALVILFPAFLFKISLSSDREVWNL